VLWNKKERKILMLPVESIQPNPEQPRQDMSYTSLMELSQSIAENGILNPLSISFVEKKPMLIAGERRLRAAKIAGLSTVPCIEIKGDRQKRALLALIENLQREEMNCFDTAEGIAKLIKIHGLTQEEAAKRLGCAQSTVANRLRLLRIPEEERRILIENGFSERHARALLLLNNELQRRKALEIMVEKKLTVAQTEKMLSQMLEQQRQPKRQITSQIRDIRIFINTINNALDTMKKSGINANAEKSETEEYIEYTVRIPKEMSPRIEAAVKKH